MNFTTLYYLMNEKHILVEIKLDSSNQSGSEVEVLQWLSISQATSQATSQVKKLIFKSMNEEMINENLMNVRVFENAELRFDKLFGKFVLGDELFILKNCTNESIPESLITIISQYLLKA